MSGYNGYTNWETWNTVLWLNNDEGLYRAFHGKEWTDETACAFCREMMPDGTPDMDETDGGYTDVNWSEVAEAMNED